MRAARRLKPWLITTLVLASLFSLLTVTLAIMALGMVIQEREGVIS
jgi:hypothetical protein